MSAVIPRNVAPVSFTLTALRAKSCTALALQCEGAKIITIEGLAEPNAPLHPMQEAFREHHALQCGFCTPGMIMAALDIVRRRGNDLDEHTIREQLDGNICRVRTATTTSSRLLRREQKPWRRVAHARPLNNSGTVGETAMSATGIGAAVRRKEDFRFITGNGQIHR